MGDFLAAIDPTNQGTKNAGLRDFLNPFGNVSSQALAEEQFKEGNARFNKYMKKLSRLVRESRGREAEALQNIQDLYTNAPKLRTADLENQFSAMSGDLGNISGELGGIGEDLGRLGWNMATGAQETSADVKKYLSTGDEYISNMLDEAMSGSEDYLSEYKKLARSELPGLSIYKDQMGANLGASIQQLKSLGGANSRSLASLLVGNQQAQSNIALEAAKYRNQAQQNLADAYMTAGQTNATAFGSAAQFSQGQAGLRQNLGEFNANIVGQRANIVSQQANIAGQRAGIVEQQAGLTGRQADLRQQRYLYNQYTPWMNQLQFEQNRANMFNPIDLAADVYGSAAGIGWSQEQSGLVSGQQSAQAAQQNSVGIIGALAQLLA